MESVTILKPSELAEIIRSKSEKVLIVDARTFCEYNTCHIINAVNVWSSKIRKKRLQQNSISVFDFLQQACHISLQEINFEEVIVYDQSASSPYTVPTDTFLHVLLVKLAATFKKVFLLQGGFLEFQSQFYEMCEDSSQKGYLLTSFSQPCLPVANCGPTKVLPFLFLGSQHDANNKQLLLEHNISYELNVSTTCPQPDFLQDSHFLRIAVNDNFSAKLLPHFGEAFRFIDKVREVGGRVLVHCIAGISRSPTIVISYVMKYLNLHYDEAYRYVKTRRPTISPNINFVGQLLEFDLHLFGNRAFFRTPPSSVYFDDLHDSSLTGSPPSSGGSLLLKSSSSSCIEAGSEPDFPFPLNRSLPSLRLNKSVDEVSRLATRQSFFDSSSSELNRLSSFAANEHKYISDRLPSTPVLCPSSPIFGELSLNDDQDLFKPSVEDLFQPIDKSLIRDENHEGQKKENSISNVERVREESKHAISNECSGEISGVCVNEGILIHLSVETETDTIIKSGDDIVVGETGNSEKKEGNSEESETGFPKPTKEELTQLTMPENEGDFHCDSPFLPSSKPATVFIPQQLGLEPNSTSENSQTKEESLLLPPKTIRNTPRKFEAPYLPRSYSSSETYLNTRMRLEKQASINPGGSNTRKSFSSDEVGKGFQAGGGIPPLATPTSVGFHKDAFTNSVELARCDSWSTSGLGSEISDWDSIQGDPQSMEDAQGPFDAVFADVFPGDCPNLPASYFRETFKKSDKKSNGDDKTELCELKKLISWEEKNLVNKQQDCSSLPTKIIGSTSASEEHLGTSPTPRPITLPGVSGTYSISDANVNVDMGVEIDDTRDWQKEEIKVPRPSNRKGLTPIEHPPVNPRTMGDNVKYIMTWYKIDPFPQPSPSPSKTSPSSGSFTDLERETDPLDKRSRLGNQPVFSPLVSVFSNDENKKQIPLIEQYNDDKRTINDPSSCYGPGSPHDFETNDRKDDCIQERWQWWENEFKKKIRSMKKNSTLVWDSSTDTGEADEGEREEECESSATASMAGFHLAQELMQSMEDLLEREISDIKKQASALSTKFGLPMMAKDSSSLQKESPCSVPSKEDVLPTVYFKETQPCQTSISSNYCRMSSQIGKVSKLGLTRLENDEFPFISPKPGGRRSHSKESFVFAVDSSSSMRAMSEPPVCLEESLYRVKSCPGISEGKDIDDIKPIPKGAEIAAAFRFPRLFFSQNGHSKRYSCSALDFLPTTRPTFESCPDVSQLRNPFKREATSGSKPAAASADSPSTFRRLLKVS